MNYSTSQAGNPYASFGTSVADSAPSDRAVFIRKTYTHLAAAIYAFAAVEWAIFSLVDVDRLMVGLIQGGSMNYIMLGMMAAFVGVSWIANSWAQSDTSPAMQYAGLVGYVVAEAVMFVPLLWMADQYSVNVNGASVGVIPAAAIATLAIFGGLTAVVWISGKDFSFMGAALGIAGFAALAAIVASVLLGFSLGVWFTVAMIAMAAGYILYETSNVMHQYRPGQHVAASLALFASVALLFWYVLRLFQQYGDRD